MNQRVAPAEADNTPICGIIRPIAEMGLYTADHWRDVASIVAEAVKAAGYRDRLVSDADDAGVILSQIVTNIYSDPIVIADVSGRNPNVMFELGMRLAFEKPVIIITDDETPFSFDISPVKHIRYSRTLKYAEINRFKEELEASITATVKAASSPSHRGYLQQFGPIKTIELREHQFDPTDVIDDLREIKRSLSALAGRQSADSARMDRMLDLALGPVVSAGRVRSYVDVEVPLFRRADFKKQVASLPMVSMIEATKTGFSVLIDAHTEEDASLARNSVRGLAAEMRTAARKSRAE